MSAEIVLSMSDPTARAIARAVGYRGRKVSAKVDNSVTLHNTYWDEGTRSTYYVVRLADFTQVRPPQYLPHLPPEFGGPKTPVSIAVNPGHVVVEHAMFCHHDMGLTITFHLADVNRLSLPASVSLTEAERCVLILTASLTPAGRARWREEHRVSKEQWSEVCEPLIARRLLTKQGAITPAGHNAIRDDPDRDHGEYRFNGLPEET
jgi:hypothetical protein